MKKHINTTIVSLLVLTTAVMAGNDYKSSKEVVAPECRFRGGELQVDAFGSGAFYQQGNPLWGGGLGLNYFVTKYIGLGVEQTYAGNETSSEWGTFGNLFLRYPICSWNLAPYVVAGIGGLYGDKSNGTFAGTVGGGLEYRFTKNIGIFSDARWLYNGQAIDNGAVLVRTGLKFAF